MKTLKRRDALKAAALAAGGLFAANASAALDSKSTRKVTVAGSWTMNDRPCAIFQQGPILLIVNEAGDLATARISGPDTFTILSGSGWARGLTAKLLDRGKRIQWSDKVFWEQA